MIEDDEDLAMIFSEALREADFEVIAIRDGLTAQNELAKTTPAVIVLDMHLPKVSGADLFDQIRSNPQFASTKIVISTADIRVKEAYQDKADFILTKPIGFSELRDLTARLH